MPSCQTCCKGAGSIIQEGWQKIAKDKTRSRLPLAQLVMMNASRNGAKYAQRPSPCQRHVGYLLFVHFLRLCLLDPNLPLTVLICFDSICLTEWMLISPPQKQVLDQQRAGSRTHVAGGSFSLWGAILAFGALIMVSTHSYQSNANVRR